MKLGFTQERTWSTFEYCLSKFAINWVFVKRDLIAVVFPGITFSLYSYVRFMDTDLLPLDWLTKIALGFSYFWFMLTFFCTSNQIFGIEEDSLNKPDRPIPSGLVSMNEAKLYCTISGIISVMLSIKLNIFLFAFIYILCTVLHNFLRWGDHWFFKSLLTSLGIFSILGSGLTIFSHSVPWYIWKWTFFVSATWLTLGHVQDLRDIVGDVAVGRKTLPIVCGEKTGRILLTLAFFIFPITSGTLFQQPLYIKVFFLLLSWLISVRILILRSQNQDKITYLLFLIMFFLTICSSFYL